MTTDAERRIRIRSLQGVVGAFCAGLGALMLIAPHQFASPTYASVTSNLALWGPAFSALGIALFSIAVLQMHRQFAIVVHLLAGAGLFVLAASAWTAGDWLWAANYGILGLATALAPVLRLYMLPPSSVNLLALALGLSGILAGIIMLAAPGQFDSGWYTLIRPYLTSFGLAFLCSGSLVAAAELYPYTQLRERLVAWVVHPFLSVVFFVFAAAVTGPALIWPPLMYYGGFGFAISLLSWLDPRLRRTIPTSLRTRLALLLSVTAAIPLVLTVAVIGERDQAAGQREALAQQQTLAETLAQGLTDYMGLHHSALDTLAEQPELMSHSPSEQIQLLSVWQRSYPDVLAFALFDTQGNIIARSDGISGTVKVTRDAVYEQALRRGETSFGILDSPIIGHPVFAWGAPVHDSHGHLAGLAVMVLESQRVSQFLAQENADLDTEVYLLDRRGRAIAHPNSVLAGSLANLSDRQPVSSLLSRADSSGTDTYTGPSGNRLVGYARVFDPGWMVVVERPTEKALASRNSSRDLAFGILALSLLVTLIGGVLVAAWMTKPLSTLADVAQELAAGYTLSPLPHTGIVEVEHLADAFGQMRASLVLRTVERERAEQALRNANEELESIVADRTMELQEANQQLQSELVEREMAEVEREQLLWEVQRQAAQLEARTRELSTLLEVSHSMASTLESERLLGLILDQLRSVVEYTGATIYALDGDELVPLATREPHRPGSHPVPLRFALQVAPAHREVITRQEPVLIPDVRASAPLASDDDESDVPEPESEPEYARSWIGVPLRVHERVIGMLVLRHSQPDAYTGDHARLVMAFANHAAVAMENAQLYTQAQELAAVQERQRLARDLHDAVSQTLFAATVIADVLPLLWEHNPDEAQRRLVELHRLTRGAMAEMRTLLLELRPAALVQMSLEDLLRQLVEAMSGQTGVPIASSIEGQATLPSDVKIVFYRVAQEALHNIAKYAQPEHASLELCQTPEAVELHVADDGVGFDASQVPPGRMGLRIMRERAHSIGAELSVWSQPGHGTHVNIVWEPPRDSPVPSEPA